MRVTGLVLEAAGVRVPVGSVCELRDASGGQPGVFAEVVGFNGDRAFLMPNGELHGLTSGALVLPRPVPHVAPRFGVDNHPWRRSEDRGLHLPVGEGLLGRVVDAHGKPLDKLGPLLDVRTEPMVRRAINAMDRDPVRQPLDTGVRAINALLTVGRGQRLGLFAGTGVGKSVLLGMMARYTAADVIVVGLIGERGREVKEFIEDILEEEGRARSVVVAAPADAPPLVRMQGASYATAIAEHFRDQGRHVLLLMDSLTRYAMAQREIALAIGEPPATKGYPPSCFAKLPQLVERSGNGLERRRLDHRVLHRAQRRRRPAGPDRRRGARHPRRPRGAVARAGRGRALSGDRRRTFDLARHDQRGQPRAGGGGAARAATAGAPQQGARPDPAGRLRARPRRRARHGGARCTRA